MGKVRTAGFILSLIMLVIGSLVGWFGMGVYTENPFNQDRVDTLGIAIGGHLLFLIGLVCALILRR